MSDERERVDSEGVVVEDPAVSLRAHERKWKRWKAAAKGKGNRWQMLRDLLAIISMRPMGINLVQDTMFLHRGLKRQTVRDMLDQLERTKSIEQIKDTTGQMPYWVWIATEGGVSFWLGSRAAIPASIVKVAHTMTAVPIFGGIKK